MNSLLVQPDMCKIAEGKLTLCYNGSIVSCDPSHKIHMVELPVSHQTRGIIGQEITINARSSYHWQDEPFLRQHIINLLCYMLWAVID